MRLCDRPLSRLALLGVLVAALGLGACGRKAGLDPPPSSSVADEPGANAGEEAKPAPTSKKSLPIDVLLN